LFLRYEMKVNNRDNPIYTLKVIRTIFIVVNLIVKKYCIVLFRKKRICIKIEK